MGPELERILNQAKVTLEQAGYAYWWDGERIGALMVKLAADDAESYQGVPRFQPCLKMHMDIEYLWRIFLGPQVGTYKIYCYEISHDWLSGEVYSLKPVNWRAVIKNEKKRILKQGV